ncbi:MAG: GNAT family N-acetyltransferase [Rhizomicrobium sp.]
MTLRDATQADHPAILALNAASVEQLSPMDEARLALLASQSAYLRVIETDGAVAAFLMAFRKGSAYRGAVFQALQSRDKDFLYIDRVVTDARRRGQGLAGRLYDDIAAFARAAGIGALLCEAYVANDVSRRFHARHGFREFGRMASHGRTVALLERLLEDRP